MAWVGRVFVRGEGHDGLLDEVGDVLGGEFVGEDDGTGALGKEAIPVSVVVGGGDDLRIGSKLTTQACDAGVVGSLEQHVGDGAGDDSGFVCVGVFEGAEAADVAEEGLDAAGGQTVDHFAVEIDDEEIVEEGGVVLAERFDEGVSGAVVAEDDDSGAVAMGRLDVRLGGPAAEPSGGDELEELVEGVAVTDGIGGEDGGDGHGVDGDGDGPLGDVFVVYADGGDDEGELADLGEVEGGDEGRAGSGAGEFEEGVDGKESGEDNEGDDAEEGQEDVAGGGGDFHAEGDEEEREEEVSEGQGFGGDMDAVREGGDAEAGDEGAHFF